MTGARIIASQILDSKKLQLAFDKNFWLGEVFGQIWSRDMRILSIQLGAAILLLWACHAPAATLYVDLNSTNPTPPYADWSSAATDIQSAVDVSAGGDLIWVNDGIYQTGGRVVYGVLTNRVVINKAVTVQSVNGAAATVIQGNRPMGNSAVRCVYLTNNATLIGFTLTNGASRTTGGANEAMGGGAWCFSASSKLINCLVVSNSAASGGGGVYFGTCTNCTLTQNTAPLGGGAYSAFLNNCTLANNSSPSGAGGGAHTSYLINCNLTGNSASGGGGAYTSYLINCSLLSLA